MERSVDFSSEEQMQRVLGINDRNLPYIEALLGCDMYVKGNTVSCLSKDETVVNRFQQSSPACNESPNSSITSVNQRFSWSFKV